ncbi:hypothetical protein ES708_28530 [subsurface metagenome]
MKDDGKIGADATCPGKDYWQAVPLIFEGGALEEIGGRRLSEPYNLLLAYSLPWGEHKGVPVAGGKYLVVNLKCIIELRPSTLYWDRIGVEDLHSIKLGDLVLSQGGVINDSGLLGGGHPCVAHSQCAFRCKDKRVFSRAFFE